MERFFNIIRSTGFRRGPERLVAGLAGSIAQSLGVNVWLVRLLVLVSFLLPVIGLGLYLLLWALTPWQDGSIPLERVLSGQDGPR
ncbi:PspC domain-containing protein [Nesterenkonia haasae]|uniref:PspC domain-containing protein n=1 Tax=Nesterenkonia haasae TaxID=2587813 RepID=UPI001391EE8E|nr:PspC domain-containing protein [Nesterenkonia haasae]NDK31583.1 PspC domain-containing protein [Nesterenkonia haasae]